MVRSGNLLEESRKVQGFKSSENRLRKTCWSVMRTASSTMTKGTNFKNNISDNVECVDSMNMTLNSNVNMNMAGIPSVEDVIAFGGIPTPVATQVRSSSRIGNQPDADATQMERAMKNAQIRNEFFNSGKKLHTKLSFLSMSDDEIVQKANRIGV